MLGRPVKSVEGDGSVQIGLRVPNALKKRLQEAAKANHRTLSKEVERRLEHSFLPIGYALSSARTESE